MTRSTVRTTLQAWHQRLVRSSLGAYLGLHLAAGALLTAGLVWVFVALADEIPEGGTLLVIDRWVGTWFGAHGTAAGKRIFVVVTMLGSAGLGVVVVGALLWLAWRRQWLRVVALGLTSAGGLLLSTGLKLLFHRGRPTTAVDFITRHTWSFPSGHSMNSLVCYGFLGMLALERVHARAARATLITAIGALVVLIGFTRLYLGVHFITDVVGGWVAGAAWLLACASAYQVVRAERARR